MNIFQYPTIISAPYIKTLSDSIQKKEYQRICLEMILSFNAVVCLSNYYSLKKDLKGKVKLGNLDFDMGMMSIGKWNGYCRTVSKTLNDSGCDIFVKEIYNLYHGSKKKEWNSTVDELIKRRNKDAHGEVIPASKLPDELHERQEMIDSVIGLLSFYKDYRLIYPYENEVKEGKDVYICKVFYDDEEHIEAISNFDEPMDKLYPYLIHLKSGKNISLSPMLVVYPTSYDSRDMNLSIYSKTLNRKTTDLHFSNWKSSTDFFFHGDEIDGYFLSQNEICRKFKRFRIHIEDETLVHQPQPSINIERKFKEKSLSIGEMATLNLILKNEGDCDTDNSKIIFDFPKEGFVRTNADGDELKQDIISVDIKSLPQGEIWEENFYFIAKDSGQYEFSSANLFYNYTNIRNEVIKPDEENGINVESSPPLLYEVMDPNDPESQIPIVNIAISYDNETPQIGDKIILTIEAKNIGRSVANDVKISILPPQEHMDLISGSPDWKGTLNPDQSVKSQFTLLPKTHGVFNMKMRDIVYSNQVGQLFKTLAYEDYKILVRNNPKVKYRFLMEDIWEDLSLDTMEQKQIDLFMDQYEIMPEECQNIESEIKIKIIKKIIQAIIKRGNWKISEIIGNGLHVYCLMDCPFVVIDYSDILNIQLLIRGPFKEKIFIDQKLSLRGKFNEISFSAVKVSALSSIGGANRLKGMINQSINWVSHHDCLLMELADHLAELLKINVESIDISMEGKLFFYKLPIGLEEKGVFANGFYSHFDKTGNVNIVASYSKSAGVGSGLKNLNYKFLKKNDLNADCPFDSNDRVTTFVHIASKKNDKHHIKALLNTVKDFLFVCTDIVKEQFLSELDKKKKLYVEAIDKIIFEHIKDFSTKVDKEKKMIVYFKERNFPIYKQGKDFLLVNLQTKNILLNFRTITKNIYDDLSEELTIKKNYWPYIIKFDETIKDKVSNAIAYSCDQAKSEIQDISYGFLKATIEYMWVSNIELLLETTINNEILTFQKANQLFRENDINGKINNALRGYSLFFSARKIDNPLKINYIDETISLKEKYYDIVKELLENYKLKIEDYKIAFHKFKLLLNKQNENRSTMQYLTRTVLPRTIFDTKNFKYKNGIYFDASFQKRSDSIRIQLSIKDNPFAYEVKKYHEKMISNNENTINDKKISVGTVKGGEEDSYKISLDFPLEDLAQMENEDWFNNFVEIFNKFAETFLAKDYNQLKLNYLKQ
jgi:uncharacterized repeat protein (TIGR01451 family)